MLRTEAVALFRELVTANLVVPAIVSIGKNDLGTFSLTMKLNGNAQAVRDFIAGKGFICEEDINGYCIVSRLR